MQSLGKVPSARRPPANLPSIKAETLSPSPSNNTSNSINDQQPQQQIQQQQQGPNNQHQQQQGSWVGPEGQQSEYFQIEEDGGTGFKSCCIFFLQDKSSNRQILRIKQI